MASLLVFQVGVAAVVCLVGVTIELYLDLEERHRSDLQIVQRKKPLLPTLHFTPCKSRKRIGLLINYPVRGDPDDPGKPDDKPYLDADTELYDDLLASRGYKNRVLKYENATAKNILGELEKLSEELVSGDALTICLICHANKGRSDDPEEPGSQEYLILSNSYLNDKDFTSALLKFRTGVLIYVLASSCRGSGMVNAWQYFHQPADRRPTIFTVGVNEDLRGVANDESAPYTWTGWCLHHVLSLEKKRKLNFSNETAITKWIDTMKNRNWKAFIPVPELVQAALGNPDDVANVYSGRFLSNPPARNESYFWKTFAGTYEIGEGPVIRIGDNQIEVMDGHSGQAKDVIKFPDIFLMNDGETINEPKDDTWCLSIDKDLGNPFSGCACFKGTHKKFKGTYEKAHHHHLLDWEGRIQD